MTTYTREQILSMPVGHSLDCMAAKLMGWTRSIAWEGRYWTDKDGCNRWEVSKWKPSLYMELAMSLLEHPEIMDKFQLGIYPTSFGKWICRSFMPGCPIFVQANTAPEAITKAAILSVIEQSGGTGK